MCSSSSAIGQGCVRSDRSLRSAYASRFSREFSDISAVTDYDVARSARAVGRMFRRAQSSRGRGRLGATRARSMTRSLRAPLGGSHREPRESGADFDGALTILRRSAAAGRKRRRKLIRLARPSHDGSASARHTGRVGAVTGLRRCFSTRSNFAPCARRRELSRRRIAW